MIRQPLRPAIGGILAAAALLAAPALNAAAAGGAAAIPSNQPVTVNLPGNAAGSSQIWTFSYPGDNSNITFDADFDPFDTTFSSAVGFNVWDAQHLPGSAPVEVATVQSNGRQNDPHGIEFNYSSGASGDVVVQLFSYMPNATNATITQGGLVSSVNGAVTPVTLQPQEGSATTTAAAAPAAAPGNEPAIVTGKLASFSVPASPNGFSSMWTFDYPGDNSNITFDADMNGLDPSFATAVGFNVFDAQHQTSPVEIATNQSNEKPLDPHGIEFNYSSGTQGPVTVQFFSYVPAALTVDFTNGGLVNPSSGAATPVTLNPIK